MSQEEIPNTTADHIRSPTQGAQSPLSAGRLPPSPTPDFPRRSSSLHPSSPAAPSAKTNDTSVQLSDGMAGAGNGEDQVADGASGGSDAGGRDDVDDARERIAEFDWEGLEERFWGKMEGFRRVEEGILAEFAELVEVFNAWTTAGAVGEEERAGKRLRTRMAFVQLKEESLEEKRSHYVKVVKAFESALALLSAP